MSDEKKEGWGVLNLVTKKYEQAKKTKKEAMEVVDDLNSVSTALKSETRYAVIPGKFSEDLFK
jgi:hypothetical protein